MYVLGVDGCRGGWLGARLNLAPLALSFECYPSFADLLQKHENAACITVDIPIGLIAGTPRDCDRQARQLLNPRHSTVFPSPDPRLIHEPDFEAARAKAKEIGCTGVSKQSAAILGKIREVNMILSAADQGRIVEVHPELGFWGLNDDRPVLSKKNRVPGFNERHILLSAALDITIPDRAALIARKLPAKPDDFLDAVVAAWIAHKLHQKAAKRLPEVPQIGWRDLKAEIAY